MLKKIINKLRGTRYEKNNLFINAVPISDADPDEWIKIVPVGNFPEHPNGAHEVTHEHVQQMAANFSNTGTDLLFDYEHNSLWGESLAAGWSAQVEAREDGLYVKYPEFTVNASQMVEGREYRYFSPVYKLDKKNKQGDSIGAIIDSVAITNRPYMDNEIDHIGNTSTGEQQTKSKNNTDMKLSTETLEKLGLSEEASQEEVNEAIMNMAQTEEKETGEKETEASEAEKNEENDDGLEAKVNSVIKRLDEQDADKAEERAEMLINSAVDQGKINPSEKDTYLTAAKADYKGTKKIVDERKKNSAMPSNVTVDDNAGKDDEKKVNHNEACADYLRGQMEIEQTGS